MKNIVGTIGIFIAIIALGIAIFQDDLRPDPPSATTQLADRVSEAMAKIGGIEIAEKASKDWVTFTYIGLGFLALIVGIGSFLRQEDHRVSGLAGVLGVVAIGWEYVLIGITVAVVLFLISYLSP